MPPTRLIKSLVVCSHLIFLADKVDDELEMTTVCHRPEGLEQLEAQTNFSKQELQILYRGFKNVIRISSITIFISAAPLQLTCSVLLNKPASSECLPNFSVSLDMQLLKNLFFLLYGLRNSGNVLQNHNCSR